MVKSGRNKKNQAKTRKYEKSKMRKYAQKSRQNHKTKTKFGKNQQNQERVKMKSK